MLLQISGLMFFDNITDRDAILTKILLWKDKGFLETNDSGDYIIPRYVKDWTDITPPAGPYKLAFRLRVMDVADRNAIRTYYTNQVEPKINKTIPGYFEGHKCYHDEKRPCKDKTIDEW
jgi:hypothetical protein